MTNEQYGVNQEQTTVDVEEGNYTYNAKLIKLNGTYTEGGSFAAQVEDGDAVQLYTGADKAVQKAASGAIIGFIDGDLRGAVPSASKNSGAYTRRYGRLTLVGYRLLKVKLAAANAAITSGDYLALDSTKNTFDKEEDNSTSNLIAWGAADASSGKSIWALEKGPMVNEAD